MVRPALPFIALSIIAVTVLSVQPGALAMTSTDPSPSVAEGTFSVQMTPVAREGVDEGAVPMHVRLDKTFEGELSGIASGELIGVTPGERGSGAYVAIERFEGVLAGRAGTFHMVHRGVMTRGAPDLLVTIVPNSGTGELSGISGRMHILIEPGIHRYRLEYTIAP